MNNTYKIGKNAGYDGCGLCLAAISDNEAVKIRYLRDICPDLAEMGYGQPRQSSRT